MDDIIKANWIDTVTLHFIFKSENIVVIDSGQLICGNETFFDEKMEELRETAEVLTKSCLWVVILLNAAEYIFEENM